MMTSVDKNAADPPAPGLYVAATPIGNLKDITLRVLETLAGVHVILCEDTRRTGTLCAHYGIKTPRRPYHDHNAAAVRPKIIADLAAGGSACLVSDAGTPLISDPGGKLVADARAAGVAVFALPGPCAAIAALSVAGAPTDRFYFAGFPPPKTAARRAFFTDRAAVDATLVFYEAPGRFAASLADMAAVFPERRATIARELTKLHEEVRAGPLAALAAALADEPAPKGEIVVLLDPPAPSAARPQDAAETEDFIRRALDEMSVRDAAAAAADAFRISKRDAYEIALAVKRAAGR